MDVVFTKTGSGYRIKVLRADGPQLAPRNGPGSNAAIPHDAAHLLVEQEAGIGAGVFGRLVPSQGLDGLFWPLDPVARKRAGKAKKVPSAAQSAEMARSEYLASLTVPLWEVARGRRAPDPVWPGRAEAADIAPDLLARIFARYDDFAARWLSLPDGGDLVVRWEGRRK